MLPGRKETRPRSPPPGWLVAIGWEAALPSDNANHTRSHRRAFIDSCAAFDRQGLRQVGVAQVQMPTRNLDVEAIGEGALQILQLGSWQRHQRISKVRLNPDVTLRVPLLWVAA